MYSNYAGDTQYPHGAEIGSMRGPVPVDPSGAPARYPYMPYYAPKGPDGAQLAAAMAQRPPYSGEYAMGNPEAMYGPGWNSMMAGQAYMSSHGGKPPYNMQVRVFFYILHFTGVSFMGVLVESFCTEACCGGVLEALYVEGESGYIVVCSHFWGGERIGCALLAVFGGELPLP